MSPTDTPTPPEKSAPEQSSQASDTSQLVPLPLHPALQHAVEQQDLSEVIHSPRPGAVYVLPFLTEEYCQYLIERADNHAGYRLETTDETAKPELRLLRIDPELNETFNSLVANWILPVITSCYGQMPAVMEPPFISKLNPKWTKNLQPHTDDLADISLSINLNDGWEGNGTEIPHFDWNTANIPPGFITMFPGGIYPHNPSQVTKGKRYVLTAWLRFRG